MRYRVVDVFTDTPLQGNPLAVFPDARGLDDLTMQAIAKELNLSETVFILPPRGSEYAARVAIFTPTMEMLFAGHPTLGASYVMVDERMIAADCDRFILEEKIGPVPVRVERSAPQMFWLMTPPITFGRIYDRPAVAQALGIAEETFIDAVPVQQATAGNPNVYIALRDKASVDRAWIDMPEVRKLHTGGEEPTCFFVFTPTPTGAYSRMFGPELRVVEDPATGSATGPLAAFMMRYELAAHIDGTRFVSEQGAKMGRRSLLHVLIHGDRGSQGIEVGGQVTPLVEATLTLPGMDFAQPK
ncbi:MAG: PhzF family phenazine biosynthesis protein [Candidatus Baltobacteraceae bacterium]